MTLLEDDFLGLRGTIFHCPLHPVAPAGPSVPLRSAAELGEEVPGIQKHRAQPGRFRAGAPRVRPVRVPRVSVGLRARGGTWTGDRRAV